MDEASGKSVKPNGKAVKRLRGQKGLTQARLAQATDLGLRTIQSVEAGEPVHLETLKVIAEKLEVGYLMLVEGKWAELVPVDAPLDVEVEIGDDYPWDAQRREKFFAGLAAVMEEAHSVKIVRVRKSSVKVTLRMSAAQAEQLVAAFGQGKLTHLGVRQVTLLPEGTQDMADVGQSDPTSEPVFSLSMNIVLPVGAGSLPDIASVVRDHEGDVRELRASTTEVEATFRLTVWLLMSREPGFRRALHDRVEALGGHVEYPTEPPVRAET